MNELNKKVGKIFLKLNAIVAYPLKDDVIDLWVDIFLTQTPNPNLIKLDTVVNNFLNGSINYYKDDGIVNIFRHYNRATPAEYAAMSREERKNYSAKLMQNRY